MKCIRLKNGAVDTIMLNEACSSGCGSFIENFANSLGYTAEAFAKEGLFAEHPVDLGTRCTVFMNSNVKQAQKEGAKVADISAGLAYSVIKNALFKVIKLSSAKELGSHIVVQGGTFHNQAVLRAFEKIAGAEVVCPDIAGLMGAFGAALIARGHDHGEGTTMLPLEEIVDLTYTTKTRRCGGCSNNCMLTVNIFPGGRRHITGNRCEKGAGKAGAGEKAPNMVAYKQKRMFDYTPLTEEEADRGTIGLPRVLNMYENYPFWATFFRELGFRAVLSPFSDRKIYELGMDSIPSESECYPAKLAHGHVQWLIDQGITTIFHPCVFYEYQEHKDAQNHYSCPMVASYAENLKNNVEAVTEGKVRYIRPFVAFTNEKVAAERLIRLCKEEWDIPASEVKAAAKAAWAEQRKAKADIVAEGQRVLREMEAKGGSGIVLAGRPYHIDPEINHGIPELIASYGLTVLTEDSLPDPEEDQHLRIVDQWVYHSRLYSAARFVRNRDDLELLQLNSFGCGLDAVTTDQVNEILEGSNKLYTLLKIDEVNNLGAVRIRIRSLIAAMNMRREEKIHAQPRPVDYERVEYTEQMQLEGYTILAPQMSPIHFDVIEPVFRRHGYHVEILNNATRKAVEEVCRNLQLNDIAATRYHAGLPDEERRENQEDFLYDRKIVMVATNAFGMGIDKSNVSYVIHYNMPQSLESYYQEAGRAGRDGSEAECILLFAPGDVQTAKYLIQHPAGAGELTEEEQLQKQRQDLERLDVMVGYCKTQECLRGYILDYFGQAHEKTCGNCGNCSSDMEERDITDEARQILICVQHMNARLGYSLGMTSVVRVLLGSRDKRLLQMGLDSLHCYGAMRKTDRGTVRAMAESLESQGYLETDPIHGGVSLTERAREVLFEGKTVTMRVPKAQTAAAARQETAADQDLLTMLKALRWKIAKQEGTPAYIVFTNASLEDMARKAPTTLEDFRKVSGVGNAKVQRYGETFVDAISDYLLEHGQRGNV